jgi:hypothetical protein
MSERDIVIGLTNANNLLFNLLIRILDSRGMVSRDLLRQKLLDLIREAQPIPDRKRYDIIQLEHLADLLSDVELEPRWRPIVIQGGKSDPTGE